MNGSLKTAYRKAAKRLFLLDYDGTVVGFRQTPAEAKPDARLLQLLARLSADNRNAVVIVSGRDKTTLEAWLGQLPITLVAEHGYFVKRPGKEWSAVAGYEDDWKSTVRPIMQADEFVALNSFIEEKATALVWHYRAVPMQEKAEIMARQLADRLRNLANRHNLVIVPGNKVVEVRLSGTDKGTVAAAWLKQKWDFVLAAGDDTTDEDLFAAMPASAFTIKIGPGNSQARQQMAKPNELLNLLDSLTTA